MLDENSFQWWRETDTQQMYALGSYSQPESDCFSYQRELRLLFSKWQISI